MELVNRSPYAAERVALQDKSGRDLLVIIVKCAYALRDGKPPAIADEQVPIRMADDFHGEPALSSVRYESDIAPHKTGTDVVLVGSACPGKGKVQVLDVSLKVGKMGRVARIFGERKWMKSMGAVKPSAPEPFEMMPLIWERAFGGKDLSAPDSKNHEQEARNPVGRGFVAKKSAQEIDGLPLPNIEDPAHLISRHTDRPDPVGFGFIGRHWQPRAAFAGTYDDAWMKGRAPLLPEDFDEAYYSGAHPSMISRPFLKGDEPVKIVNIGKRTSLGFLLPGDRPGVRMLMGEDPFPVEMTFDTLILEPDLDRMIMLWRGAQDIHGRVDQVEGIEISLAGGSS